MSQFTIQQIFQDNWNNFVIDNPNILIRDSIFDEVNKVINCGNPDFGYAIYICEHCGKFLKVPFRCKSRFCNTCGVKYAQDRALSMSKKSFRCKHRHIVFTMSDKLWPYFLKYRNGILTFICYVLKALLVILKFLELYLILILKLLDLDGKN